MSDHLVPLQLLLLSDSLLAFHDQIHVLLCLEPRLFSPALGQFSLSSGLLKLPISMGEDSLRDLLIFLLLLILLSRLVPTQLPLRLDYFLVPLGHLLSSLLNLSVCLPLRVLYVPLFGPHFRFLAQLLLLCQ